MSAPPATLTSLPARIRGVLSPREWTSIAGMALFIAALHVAGWGVLAGAVAPAQYQVSSGQVFGIGLGVTAYTLGMRHAFDADHIAAIDNTTRKLMAEGKRPVSVGFWFSLGHSSIVFGLCVLLALGVKALAGQVENDASALQQTTGLIGATVSGVFLYIIGIINLVILVGIVKVFHQMRPGAFDEAALEAQLNNRGLMNRLLGGVTKAVTKPWQMYPVGLHFGLGFDTATEVSPLILGGARTTVRALASHASDGILSRELGDAAMRVEQLATQVLEATAVTASRADDVAVAVAGRGPLTLAEVIEQWSREARDTVRSATPSARDQQGLAADLAGLAAHSRAIIRAGVGEKLINPEDGQRIDKALAESADGWLDIAERWTGYHTAQPPTQSKIATSHALVPVLIAVTRDAREWADPRGRRPSGGPDRRSRGCSSRAIDVARDVAERLTGLPESLAAAGQLFAPAALLAPSVDRRLSRLRGGLRPVGEHDIPKLVSSVRRQTESNLVAARLLDPTKID